MTWSLCYSHSDVQFASALNFRFMNPGCFTKNDMPHHGPTACCTSAKLYEGLSNTSFITVARSSSASRQSPQKLEPCIVARVFGLSDARAPQNASGVVGVGNVVRQGGGLKHGKRTADTLDDATVCERLDVTVVMEQIGAK